MTPLFAHQVETIAFAETRPRTYDSSSPGTGKTRSVIEIFAKRRLLGAGCLLVLAPRSILRSAWADDFMKYAPHLVTSIAFAANREKAFAVNADVYITNTDAVVALNKQPAAFWKRFHGGMLVLDEADAYKHHTSQRSKALGRIANHFTYRHAMSGTPNANSVTELWHQYKILDDGKRLGTSFYQFRNAVCEPVQIGPAANMIEWKDKDGIADAVAALIADITIRHKFEDCVDIPPNFETIVHYHLTARQLRIYDEMRTMGLAQVAKDKLIGAVNGAAVTTKLLQIASGAIYDGDGGYDLIDTGRYELVCDLIEKREKCVVFFLWKHQRDQLVEEMERRKITFCVIDGATTDKQRSDAVRHFQAGFFKVCLAHPQSASLGLTLTKGTTTIWVSPTYNLTHFLQGNQRIYRAGQTLKTETIMVIAPGTLEEGVAMKLQAKELRQGDLLALLEA